MFILHCDDGDDGDDDGDDEDAMRCDDGDDDDDDDVEDDDDAERDDYARGNDDDDTRGDDDARADDDSAATIDTINQKAVESYVTAARKAAMTDTQTQETAPAAIVREQQQQQHQQQISVTAEVHSVGPGRRSHSVDRPARMLKPSSQVMRTQAGVNVFSGGNKEDWRIVPAADTKALLVGDSNLRQFAPIPSGWEVHCLPGARFNHINNALQDVLINRSNTLSVVYVQAGINHRDQHPDEYRRQLERLMMLNSQTEVTIAFVGVPRSRSWRQSSVATSMLSTRSCRTPSWISSCSRYQMNRSRS